MEYREIAPKGPAARFVACYWMMDDDSDGAVQRIVPDGRPELIVNLGRPYESERDGEWHAQPEAFFAGQITRPLLLRSRGGARVFGVRFHPHAAAAVLRAPMQEFADCVLPLPKLAAAVQPPRRASGVAGTHDMADHIAHFERSILRATPTEPDALIAHAVDAIAASGGQVDIATLASLGGVSCRQFERRFLTCVGMPPKLFCRIQRFRRVFTALEAPDANWVDAAIDCGYYDQAHLIRDFKEFSGHPPAMLLTEADFARHFVSHFSKTRAARIR